LWSGLTDAAFQIVLQQLSFQLGGRGLDSPGRLQRLALFSLKRNQRLNRSLDLFAHPGDFGDALQQLVMRI